ncbi:PTS system mannose/fructose/N-acetylgalactosamine-transporter subunit IIB [Anaeropeptidivorans aminofermentans]|jgi:mannose/fructose/N-acetylgalactosamine-specific phosphotransferase system component IIB|uniref:PTS system mannose/fructose/N-acetylgalactosamine-transporter subunit IIB n=1 Tax=Anaeropeptidivorans aminofermentans TaxID=2934315 RepID=UPI0020256366|nr:PTS sugar transporter subunit IIB [Anaeropeptidivorans aminofermentans]MBE6012828.1 PTS sugar transporter subunit IIB [Lachnospiraceae bacterium]
MGSVKLARVDERLVHGQVMTNLSKSAGANAIFIVDDEVVKDDFMKTIFISSGSRTGLTVKIFSVDDAVEYWNTKQFDNHNVILLTKNISTIYEIVKKGIPVTELNLGGIAKRPATTYIINAVAIDKEAADKLKDLRDSHKVNVYFQSIPSNPKVDLDEALKKFA